MNKAEQTENRESAVEGRTKREGVVGRAETSYILSTTDCKNKRQPQPQATLYSRHTKRKEKERSSPGSEWTKHSAECWASGNRAVRIRRRG